MNVFLLSHNKDTLASLWRFLRSSTITTVDLNDILDPAEISAKLETCDIVLVDLQQELNAQGYFTWGISSALGLPAVGIGSGESPPGIRGLLTVLPTVEETVQVIEKIHAASGRGIEAYTECTTALHMSYLQTSGDYSAHE